MTQAARERVLQAVVEHLALELAEMEESYIRYRELAQVATAQLHEAHQENLRLRRNYESAREDLRRFTAEQVAS